MSNSWVMSKVNPTDGHVQLGTFIMIPADSRTSGFDIDDSSVTNTFEEADLSALVPANTTAVYGVIDAVSSSANDQFILVVRSADDTSGATAERVRLVRLNAEIGAAGNIQISCPVTIHAPGGIFEYAEYSTSFPVSVFRFVLWGYWVK